MYKTIIDKVKNILDDCNITSAPIPVVEIAEKYGFVVVEKFMDDDESGYMILSPKGVEVNGEKHNKIIVINTTEIPHRKRFTIAHELGHYFLEYKEVFNSITNDVIVHREYNTRDLEKERAADEFAGELLVPTDMLQVMLANTMGVELLFTDLPELISKKFGVSYTAARVCYDKYMRRQNVPR